MPTALVVALMLAAAPAAPSDLMVVHRIKVEATARSQVMDHLFWLSDANGPRLTGSPG
jgi:carboxypeptidase Q